MPLETLYYEVYNRHNVELVDIIGNADRAGSRPRASRPATDEYEFDIIIYATGFDAITGSFDKIDPWRRRRAAERRWKGGPQTFLGVMVEGFPNMLMLMGPHTGARQYSAQHRV